MMKKVLILFDKMGRAGLSCESRRQFADLYSFAEKRGIEFCRAPIKAYNLQKRFFTKAQFYKKDRWIWKKNIVPDIIYDKSPFVMNKRLQAMRLKIEKDFTFINSLKLSNLLSNKWKTYKKFSKFSPKTVLINQRSDLRKIKGLKTNLVILKPLFGSGGKGIKIYTKDKIRPTRYPFIAQKFVSARKGIPGLVNGPHDLRVFLAKSEKPFYSYIRTPKEGELISNYSQGGSLIPLPVSKIPKKIYAITRYVSKKLSAYEKKFYSIDFIFDDNQRPWILEMNSRPGITVYKEELDYREYFYNHITEFFLKLL